MNMINKILTALALISVIVAAGVYVYVQTFKDPDPVIPPSAVPEVPPSVHEVSTSVHEVGKMPASSAPIEVSPSDPLQPKYVPINSPKVLQNLREEGKSYKCSVLGKVEGKAYKKDWGIAGTSHFVYTYGFTSVGKIIKNDGMTIVEERSFDNVVDEVMVSDVELGFELPATEIGVGVGVLSTLFGTPVDPVDVAVPIQMLNEVRVPVTAEKLEALAKYLPDSLDVNKLKGKLQMFTHEKGGLLLMGKTVRITFVDGQGIKKIEPVNCTLSADEVDAIKRSNYVMDHYLMPDREVRVGEQWSVPADVFSGLLDTHIKGKVTGSVQIERGADFRNAGGKLNYRLKLADGKIEFRTTEGGNAITGKLSNIRGISIMPHDNGVVTSASLIGFAEYSQLSQDHLLFEAKMTVQPRFEVKYDCEVIDGEEAGHE